MWHLQRREFVSSHEIRTYDVQGAIAAHGQRLFFVTRSSELCVWNLASGGEEKRIPLGMIPYSICVDSEGRRAAINDAAAPLLRILDLESGEDMAGWSRDVGNRGMAWSGDGQFLAVGDESGEIFIRHVPTGEVLSVLEGQVTWLAFSNRGYLLATAGWSGTTELWDAGTVPMGGCSQPPTIVAFDSWMSEPRRSWHESRLAVSPRPSCFAPVARDS